MANDTLLWRDCCGDRQNVQPRLMSSQGTRKQVDQDPEDLICFGNEPRGGLPVKPARRPSIQHCRSIVPLFDDKAQKDMKKYPANK